MFTFNNIDSTNFLKENAVRHSLLPSVENKFVKVPNRNVAFDFGYSFDVRRIEIDVTIIGTSNSDLRTKTREIANWLFHEELKTLTFSDEPTITYQARINGSTDLDQILHYGQGTLVFVCPNPFGIGASISATVTTDTIPNAGTFETPPVLKATFTANASEFKITNNTTGEFVRVIRDFVLNDVLVIDCENSKISVNGVSAMIDLDIASDFFNLTRNGDSFTVSPVGVATTKIEYQERWL